MKQTEKYGLNLFEGSDRLQVGPVNENTERLEGALSAAEEKAGKALDESWQMGDVRFSARADLDERWLLCNGDVVDRHKYPELDDLLGKVQTTSFAQHTFGIKSTKDILRGIAEDGETMLVVGGSAYNGAPLAFAVNHPDHTWTNLQVDSVADLRCAAFAEGKWVAGGISHTGGKYELVVYATDDLYGKWERAVVAEASATSYYISSLAYGGGKWVATAYLNTSDSVHVYVADDPAGEWRRVEVDPDTKVGIHGVAHHNGRWMICGNSGVVCFADDPEGVWTKAGTPGTDALYTVVWGGGKWVAAGAAVYSAEDPYGTWTTTAAGMTVRALRWDEELGLWVAAGVASSTVGTVGYAADPAGIWATITVGSGKSLYGVGRLKGVWAVVGQSVNSSDASANRPQAYTFKTLGDTPAIRLFLVDTTEGAVATHDGVWVAAIGGNMKNGYAPVCVARMHDGYWGLNFAGGGTLDVTLNDVCRGGEAWTAVGKVGNYPAVCTAEDPFGAWAVRQISTSVQCELNAVAFHDGLWVACGTSGYVWCAEDPAGEWTPYLIASGSLLDIAVWDGLWAAISSQKIWTANEPKGVATWTEGVPPVTSGMRLLACKDGLWAIEYTASSVSYISVSDSPGAGWGAGERTGISGTAKSLCKAGAWWWAADASNVYQAAEPAGAWTECASQSEVSLLGLGADEKNAVALGKSTGTLAWPAALASCRKLPAISADQSYVYIRGKE